MQTVHTELANEGYHQMKNELKRYHVIVIGKVQGVGFRYNTKLKADELGIVGWVRNRQDGTVEILAEARLEQLGDFNSYLWKGPPGALVRTMEPFYGEPATGEFDEFKIHYWVGD